MFRFPTLHLSNGDDYVEKALPGPGPNSNRHIGLRKRRALGQTVAVFAVLGIVGLWMGGIHLPGLLKGGQRESEYWHRVDERARSI